MVLAPRLALWYLESGLINGSRINGRPVLPALLSRGRVWDTPAGGAVGGVLLLPLPSMSWFNSLPNLQKGNPKNKTWSLMHLTASTNPNMKNNVIFILTKLEQSKKRKEEKFFHSHLSWDSVESMRLISQSQVGRRRASTCLRRAAIMVGVRHI